MQSDILKQIVADKREELSTYNFTNIESDALKVEREVISMSSSIRSSTKGGIIAEFKRRSPSKGWINEGANPLEVVEGYRNAGAAACSVLTNTKYFGGSIDYLIAARTVAGDMPLLRKEFIVDERQIFEARKIGADAILLIASCLTPTECAHLAAVARSLSLEVLLEIHGESELIYLDKNIDIIGVNNRNLSTFKTEIETSFRLAEQIKAVRGDIAMISESGIENPSTIKELQSVGYDGFLIGETFMKESSPRDAISRFISSLC